MSALLPIADIGTRSRNVRFVTKADSCTAAKDRLYWTTSSVVACFRWNSEAKYLRGFEISAQLLRRGRERRQFANVARVVLDDYRRLGIRRDLLKALERRDRLCAIIVEPRHAVRVVILAEVGCIARDDHGARLRQLDEKAVMARRVPGRVEHDHAAIAEHVLVVHERLDLVLTLGPTLEWFVVHALGRVGARDPIPVALADQQQRLGKRRDLAGVIGMIVADADIFNLIGLE